MNKCRQRMVAWMSFLLILLSSFVEARGGRGGGGRGGGGRHTSARGGRSSRPRHSLASRKPHSKPARLHAKPSSKPAWNNKNKGMASSAVATRRGSHHSSFSGHHNRDWKNRHQHRRYDRHARGRWYGGWGWGWDGPDWFYGWDAPWRPWRYNYYPYWRYYTPGFGVNLVIDASNEDAQREKNNYRKKSKDLKKRFKQNEKTLNTRLKELEESREEIVHQAEQGQKALQAVREAIKDDSDPSQKEKLQTEEKRIEKQLQQMDSDKTALDQRIDELEQLLEDTKNQQNELNEKGE